MLGADRQQGKRLTSAGRTFATVDGRRLEKELASQQEVAYRRLVADLAEGEKGGCRRDTGARLSEALEGQSSAAETCP
jgi:hypothetical protein